MTGFIKQLYVKNGQYVEAGQPIIMVSQNRTLVFVPKFNRNMHLFWKPFQLQTSEDSEGKTYSLEELNGKVLSFGNRLPMIII